MGRLFNVPISNLQGKTQTLNLEPETFGASEIITIFHH